MSQFLNDELCATFRKAISSSPIFNQGEEQKKHYDLICAVMDRLDTCVKYLNNHTTKPTTEEDFIIFVMFGCMMVDAVKKTLKALKIPYKYNNADDPANYQYFKDVCMGYPLNISEADCPTDEKFIEYFRSLVFAHPVETNRANFLKKNNEKHYSPWVIVNSFDPKIPNGVGARIYSDAYEGWENIKDLKFPFSKLQEFLKSRYELIEQATMWAKGQISETEAVWVQRKVNRTLPAIDILKDIADILESRFFDDYSVDDAISCLECKSTVLENETNVAEFRNAIINAIPDICDAVDLLDNETWVGILDDILRAFPKSMHNSSYYQLEKIYTYLQAGNEYAESGNFEWGLKQAELFADEFAKKYVIIKPYEMDIDEIKMLVMVACYFEKKAQGEKK